MYSLLCTSIPPVKLRDSTYGVPDTRLDAYRYWGQDGAGSQQRLSHYCQDDSIDVFPLAFLYIFRGKGGEPVIDFANVSRSGGPRTLCTCAPESTHLLFYSEFSTPSLLLWGHCYRITHVTPARVPMLMLTVSAPTDVQPVGQRRLPGHGARKLLLPRAGHQDMPGSRQARHALARRRDRSGRLLVRCAGGELRGPDLEPLPRWHEQHPPVWRRGPRRVGAQHPPLTMCLC